MNRTWRWMVTVLLGSLAAGESGCGENGSTSRGNGGTSATASTGGEGGVGAAGGAGAGAAGGTGGAGGASCDPARCPAPSNECRVAVCDEAGQCGEQSLEDGTVAMEQSAGDCRRKVCQRGAVVEEDDDSDVPEDGNDCTEDACNAGAAVHTPTAIETPCGADMKCDGTGLCVGCITVADCPAPGNACIQKTCDGGRCGTANKGNGTACNDGNACTQSDICQFGSCLGVDPVTCVPLDQCHNAGTCNPSTGVCSTPNKGNGVACNDGNACTQMDICQLGSCLGANPVTCVPLNQCHVAGTCNPNTGVCNSPNKPNGTACAIGGQSGTCQAGNCLVP